MFYDCLGLEPAFLARGGVPTVVLDLQEVEVEETAFYMVQMVSMKEVDEEECLVTFDSGADVSVLPIYGSVGERRPGTKDLNMVGAQEARRLSTEA